MGSPRWKWEWSRGGGDNNNWCLMCCPQSTKTGRLWLSQWRAPIHNYPPLSLYLLFMPSSHLSIIPSFTPCKKCSKRSSSFFKKKYLKQPAHYIHIFVLKIHLLLLQRGEIRLNPISYAEEESGGIVNVGKWMDGRWAKEGRLKMATSLAVLSRSLRMRERREQKSYKTT